MIFFNFHHHNPQISYGIYNSTPEEKISEHYFSLTINFEQDIIKDSPKEDSITSSYSFLTESSEVPSFAISQSTTLKRVFLLKR
jgi:hypothetical protein